MDEMKRIATLLLLMLSCGIFLLPAAVRIIPENGKFDTRFLVVIDSGSFAQASQEGMAYKNGRRGTWRGGHDRRLEFSG